jgi:hypothetical protein
MAQPRFIRLLLHTLCLKTARRQSRLSTKGMMTTTMTMPVETVGRILRSRARSLGIRQVCLPAVKAGPGKYAGD